MSVLILALIFGIDPAYAIPSCIEEAAETYHYRNTVSPLRKNGGLIDPNAKIQVLGEGGSGTVIRTIDPNSQPEQTFKIYKDAPEMTLDIQCMQALHKVYQKPTPHSFQLVKIESRISEPHHQLFVTEVTTKHGVMLDELLANRDLSPARHRELVSLYRKRRDDWAQRLLNAGYVPGTTNPRDYNHAWSMIPAHTPNALDGELVLRPGSILVDLETLEMTLIDPR